MQHRSYQGDLRVLPEAHPPHHRLRSEHATLNFSRIHSLRRERANLSDHLLHPRDLGTQRVHWPMHHATMRIEEKSWLERSDGTQTLDQRRRNFVLVRYAHFHAEKEIATRDD